MDKGFMVDELIHLSTLQLPIDNQRLPKRLCVEQCNLLVLRRSCMQNTATGPTTQIIIL